MYTKPWNVTELMPLMPGKTSSNTSARKTSGTFRTWFRRESNGRYWVRGPLCPTFPASDAIITNAASRSAVPSACMFKL